MPFINPDFIKDLQNRVDIVSTINKRIKLTQKGNNYKCCCPFHQEKTPSFTVSQEKQAFYCFGCGEHGYLIDFVMKHDNLNYVDAIEKIADENGIEVEYDNVRPENAIKRDKITQLINLSADIANYYKTELKKSTKAIEYAKNRGISGNVAKIFSLGYAPNSWQNLVNKFINEEDKKNLLELNLIKYNSTKNIYYDLLVDRLIFPITNNKSQIIAFGGRTLDKNGKPKYLNSPASNIFDKSSTLYGLDIARKYSKKLEYLLVVEGYMDVISLHQNGITEVVATLGTATTKEHIEILKRNTNKIIFCFDGDTAGRNAALKALKVVLPAINVNTEFNFLFMPSGKDPDDVIKQEGLLNFQKLINNATKLSKFLFESIIDDDFNSVEGKTKFIKQAKDLINLVNYPTYKQQLIQNMSETLGQELDMVMQNFEEDREIINTKTETNITINQNSKTHINIKNHLAKIAGIVLKNSNIIDKELSDKINNIAKDKILEKILKSINYTYDTTYQELINQFKNNDKIYNRLLYLVNTTANLTPSEAKDEINNVLNKIKKINADNNKDKIKNFEQLSEEEKTMLISQISDNKKSN